MAKELRQTVENPGSEDTNILEKESLNIFEDMTPLESVGYVVSVFSQASDAFPEVFKTSSGKGIIANAIYGYEMKNRKLVASDTSI